VDVLVTMKALAAAVTMRAPRAGSVLAAALMPAIAVCACGGATSAAPAVLDAEAAVSAAAANPVTVSPLPGTQDASPATQISFLGRAGTKVADVRVVGSRSGVHGGALRGYSTGTGESFLPSHPFLSGERVTVHARVRTAASTRAASTTFTIAHQAAVSQTEFPVEAGDPRAVQRYSSAPSLTPSSVRIVTPAQPGATPGYLFLAPYQGAGSPGPMIVDQRGNLVWFHPLAAGQEATNFGVQQYRGKPVLTWWQGRIIKAGFGEGEDVLYDSSYRRVAEVRAGNGYHADLHEIRITPQGTAWIDVFDPIHADLSSVHGAAAGVLTDSVVQEIDVKTGLVMWEWHALGHIPVGESNNPVRRSGYPWDYVHINSIDPGSAGDVLLSARNTWALYDVNIHSGGLNWRLGGRHSSFKLGPGTPFYWQHDARFQPGGLISMFDNGSDPPKEKQSRGLLLRPDTAKGSVSLVGQFVHPTKTLLAESQGNALNLPGGNWLLGYGRLPNITEVDGSGHVLFDATLGRDVQNFESLLAQWSGQPTTPPSLAIQRSGTGAVTVAASWNGATNVASWRLLAGSSPSALAPVATGTKAGFQTTIAAQAARPYIAVQALDSSGTVIGTSPTVKG
jgi:Arylsulfotransferase (ASST)